jgi:hypothetical protein
MTARAQGPTHGRWCACRENKTRKAHMEPMHLTCADTKQQQPGHRGVDVCDDETPRDAMCANDLTTCDSSSRKHDDRRRKECNPSDGSTHRERDRNQRRDWPDKRQRVFYLPPWTANKQNVRCNKNGECSSRMSCTVDNGACNSSKRRCSMHHVNRLDIHNLARRCWLWWRGRRGLRRFGGVGRRWGSWFAWWRERTISRRGRHLASLRIARSKRKQRTDKQATDKSR